MGDDEHFDEREVVAQLVALAEDADPRSVDDVAALVAAHQGCHPDVAPALLWRALRRWGREHAVDDAVLRAVEGLDDEEEEEEDEDEEKGEGEGEGEEEEGEEKEEDAHVAKCVAKLRALAARPQIAQRTLAWFLRKIDLLSGTDAQKALGSQRAQNSVIYRKCQLHQWRLRQPPANAPVDLTSDPEPTQTQEHEHKVVSLRPVSLRPVDPAAAEEEEEVDAKTVVLDMNGHVLEDGADPDFDADCPFRECSVRSPMHWGKKYEPVSAMVYAHTYGVQLQEYGLLVHTLYPFIGASPDGAVVGPRTSERFGRLLEIKNVVSRVIDGRPSADYWAQMQFQMEVCDIDACDFLETKFVEYVDAAAFRADQHPDDPRRPASPALRKGTILCFHDLAAPHSPPEYEYVPIDLPDEAAERAWIDDAVQSRKGTHFYGGNAYWRLDVFSCNTIARDRSWFQKHLPTFADVYATILRERDTGFAHRAPVPRAKKRPREEVCLL